MKDLYLIDISSMFFRSYYAISPGMKNKQGLPTNALYGVLKMIHKLIREKKPGYMICCFDSKEPSFRKEIYPAYKANRGEMPEDLALQAPYLMRMMEVLGIACAKQPGFEADDLAASLAKRWLEQSGARGPAAEGAGAKDSRVYIVSGDKDFAQLIDGRVFLYDTMKEKIYGPAETKEKWGVRPDQMLDYLSLTGDSSDNIPGARGVGPKSAARLLSQFSSLEEIYESAGSLKGSLQKKLQEGKENVFLSKKLIRLRDDLERGRAFSEAAVRGLDSFPAERARGLKEFLEELGFQSFVNIFFPRGGGAYSSGAAGSGKDPAGEAGGPAGPAGRAESAPGKAAKGPRLQPAEEAKALQAAGKKALKKKPGKNRELLSFEDFFQSLEPLSSIGIEALGDYICLAQKRRLAVLAPPEWKEAARRLDEKWIRYAGYDLKALWRRIGCRQPIAEWDSMLAAHLLDSRPQSSFEALCRLYLNGESALDEEAAAIKAPLQTAEGLASAAFRRAGPAAAKAPSKRGQPKPLPAEENKSLFDLLPPESLQSRGEGQPPAGAPVSLTKTEAQPSGPPESLLGKSSGGALSEERLAPLFQKRLREHQKLREILERKLQKLDLARVFRDIELPFIAALYDMERRGILLNEAEIKKQSESLTEDLESLERRIHEAAGRRFNVSSPRQMAEVLFEGLKIPKGRKTKSGYSTDSRELSGKKSLHPIIPLILERRELFKLKTAYTDSLLSLIDPETKRIYSQFRQAATSTGRLSSAHPNLQNIPIRGERGRQIRQAFEAPPGSRLISADYSQLELRILAHITEDPGLVKAFAENLDIHAAAAAEIFHVPLKAVTPDMRRKSKAVNFGIAYGQGAHGLSEALAISKTEAKEVIGRYFERFRKIRDYIESAKEAARRRLYVKTIFGRKRFFDERDFSHPRLKAAAERAAINAPIQGTASDLMKIAMIHLDQSLPIPILSQIHDELLFECPEEDVEGESREIISIMEGCAPLKVPLKVNLASGSTWAEAHGA